MCAVNADNNSLSHSRVSWRCIVFRNGRIVIIIRKQENNNDLCFDDPGLRLWLCVYVVKWVYS